MSYELDWSNPGKPTITLNPGQKDSTATSLVLFGKGAPNYGEGQQENFIRLLENFASPTEPVNPTIGQIWFNTDLNQLAVYNNERKWVPLSGVYVQDDEPLPAISYPGTLWYKPSTGNFFICSSAGIWIQLDNIQIMRIAYNQEYNELVDIYNSIVGTMTVGMRCSDTFGWGQTGKELPHMDLPLEPVTNVDWINLLTKFKEIAPIVDVDPQMISNNGFIIEDHLNTPYGIGTVIDDFIQTKDAVDAIYLNRFNTIESSLVGTNLLSKTGVTWANTQDFEFTYAWNTKAEKDLFFATGGYLQLTPALTKNIENDLTFIWEQLFYELGGGIKIKACLTVDHNETLEFVKNISIFELDANYKEMFKAVDRASIYAGTNQVWDWNPTTWLNAEINNSATVATFKVAEVNSPMIPDPTASGIGEATIISPGDRLLGGNAELIVNAKMIGNNTIVVKISLVDKSNTLVNAVPAFNTLAFRNTSSFLVTPFTINPSAS